MHKKPVTKTQITIRIPIDTLVAIRADAKLHGIPHSEIFRRLWDLRVKMENLPDNQRVAIVDCDTGAAVEFLDLFIPIARKPRRKPSHVDAETEIPNRSARSQNALDYLAQIRRP